MPVEHAEHHTPESEAAEVSQHFHQLVNMSADELQEWLETPESQAVGMHKQELGGESVGHHSGRQIIQILQKRPEEYTEDEIAHMRHVVSYIKRHLAQRHHLQNTNPEHSKWRYSLKNWGHDPMKGDLSEL